MVDNSFVVILHIVRKGFNTKLPIIPKMDMQETIDIRAFKNVSLNMAIINIAHII